MDKNWYKIAETVVFIAAVIYVVVLMCCVLVGTSNGVNADNTSKVEKKEVITYDDFLYGSNKNLLPNGKEVEKVFHVGNNFYIAFIRCAGYSSNRIMIHIPTSQPSDIRLLKLE